MSKYKSPASGRKSSGRAGSSTWGTPGMGTQPGRSGGGYAVCPKGKAKQPKQENGLTRRRG